MNRQMNAMIEWEIPLMMWWKLKTKMNTNKTSKNKWIVREIIMRLKKKNCESLWNVWLSYFSAYKLRLKSDNFELIIKTVLFAWGSHHWWQQKQQHFRA